MTLREPLSPPAARKLIRAILADGAVNFSKHARDEMAKDRLAEIDIVNVLRGGIVAPGEWEHGSWRYQVRTSRMVTVVAFRSESMLVVVTAWRLT
jgi:hypothetical protein